MQTKLASQIQIVKMIQQTLIAMIAILTIEFQALNKKLTKELVQKSYKNYIKSLMMYLLELGVMMVYSYCRQS